LPNNFGVHHQYKVSSNHEAVWETAHTFNHHLFHIMHTPQRSTRRVCVGSSLSFIAICMNTDSSRSAAGCYNHIL